MTYKHLPANIAQTAYASAASEAVERFIPNIRVNQVIFDNTNIDGELNPIIEVTYYE